MQRRNLPTPISAAKAATAAAEGTATAIAADAEGILVGVEAAIAAGSSAAAAVVGDDISFGIPPTELDGPRTSAVGFPLIL